jgi:hypothetical protein
MTLGSTQPLTEMRTRNLPGGKGRPALKADNLNAVYESIVWQIWEPWRLTYLWAPTACCRVSFTLFTCIIKDWLSVVLDRVLADIRSTHASKSTAEKRNPVSTARWQAWLVVTPSALRPNLSFEPTGLGIEPVLALAQKLTCNDTLAFSSQSDTCPLSWKWGAPVEARRKRDKYGWPGTTVRASYL